MTLKQHILDTLKEWQVKLGDLDHSICLYYPREVILHYLWLEKETPCEEVVACLKEYLAKELPMLGEVQVEGQQIRCALKVGETGIRYVEDVMPQPEFLTGFLEVLKSQDMVEIYRYFHTYAKAHHTKVGISTEEEELGYIFYFKNEDVEPYVYCLEESELGITYHRFAREDAGFHNADVERKVNRREQEKENIIDTLASDYSSVYHVGLDEDRLRIVKTTAEVEQRHGRFMIEKNGYERVFGQFIETGVQEEDKSHLRQICSCATLKKLLREKKSFVCQYHDLQDTIWEIKFVKVEEETAEPHNVVIGFLNRNNEIREEMARKEEQQRKLKEALEKANAANKAKSRFLQNMSHDIRTPMNAILGFSQLAIEEIDDSDKVKDYLNRVISSGNHLLTLINAVLDMSRIESGKIVLKNEVTNLRQFMKQMGNMLMVDAKKRKQTLLVKVDVNRDHVICDQVRLSQIILNCASNALKYTPQGGHVELHLVELPEEREGYGNYKVVVSDNGIGMSPEFAARMFEPFEREQSSTVSGIQGTGLGMAITKNLVEMMNGRIEVKTKQGEGTTICIYLEYPLTQENELKQERAAIRRRMPELSGATILLVEDIAINREFISAILEKTGATVIQAENGKEAVELVEKAKEGDLQLIFMDIQMPVLDGYGATKAIRQLPFSWTKKVPIVAMTANAFAEDKRAALEIGMNDYLAKPVDIIELYQKLRTYITK
ncbi:Signal transduction histidine kinase [Lachnospiraceae bacterium XBB1006]|nr:Signal transduction histidine kinase [Lachnospiraceae bacterium XBB1006]